MPDGVEMKPPPLREEKVHKTWLLFRRSRAPCTTQPVTARCPHDQISNRQELSQKLFFEIALCNAWRMQLC